MWESSEESFVALKEDYRVATAATDNRRLWSGKPVLYSKNCLTFTLFVQKPIQKEALVTKRTALKERDDDHQAGLMPEAFATDVGGLKSVEQTGTILLRLPPGNAHCWSLPDTVTGSKFR